jgi:hypothetical protein
MNLRCIYCQTPFTLGRMEKLAAIQKLQAEELHHYDAFCPRCRRSNPVSIQRLEIFTPGWQEGLRTLEAEAALAEKPMLVEAASVLPAKASHAPSAHSKRRHASKSASARSAKASKTKPAPAKKSAAKPAAKKPAAKPAPAKSKKPAVKKTSKPAAKSKR